MHERLKEVRSKLGLNQADFAKSLGIGLSTLGMMEIGKRNILDRHIKIVCSIHNVNEDWLRTGEGEMFVQSETFSFDEQVKKSNLTELETSIMRGYMELSRDTREEIVAMLENIILQRNESAASVELTPEQIADQEAESYRQEILAELKTKKSSASDEQNTKELG